MSYDLLNIGDALTPEARDELRDLARRSVELSVRMAEIGLAEAVRLSTDAEGEMTIRRVIGEFYTGLCVGNLERAADEMALPEM